MNLFNYRYTYGGTLSLEEYDILDCIKILVAANELGLQELVIYLQSCLLDNNRIWLYKDLNKNFLILDPDSRPNKKSNPHKDTSSNLRIDSKIISVQHAELISKWIDRLEINDYIKNPYKFKLLFRGSRDGATSRKFH